MKFQTSGDCNEPCSIWNFPEDPIESIVLEILIKWRALKNI